MKETAEDEDDDEDDQQQELRPTQYRTLRDGIAFGPGGSPCLGAAGTAASGALKGRQAIAGGVSPR